MQELFNTLWQLVEVLTKLVTEVLLLSLTNSLVLVWLAIALFAIDWRKMWRVLAEGAWMPFLLLLLVSALVWASLQPSTCTCLSIVSVPNFWWQLGAVGLFAAVTLFCGWLQGVLGVAPPEIQLEPAAHGHAHGHGDHGHGHGHGGHDVPEQGGPGGHDAHGGHGGHGHH